MKTSSLSLLIAAAALSLLSGCGGTNDGTTASTEVMAAVAQSAAVADCEAEGCNRPRIIDRLAEQYRADAQQAQTPVQGADPAEAYAALPANAPANDAVRSQAVDPNNPHNLPNNPTIPDNTPANNPDNTTNPDQTASAPQPDASGQPQQAQQAQ